MYTFSHPSGNGRHFVIIKKEIQEHTNLHKGGKHIYIPNIAKTNNKKPTVRWPKVKSWGAQKINVFIRVGQSTLLSNRPILLNKDHF